MLTFRQAEETDLETIVDLLADDPLGKKREQAVRPIPLCYKKAFAAVQGDPNHELIVACEGEEVIGCMQLSFLPGLTYQGGWRMQLEGVRVSADARGRGIGTRMLAYAVDRAKKRGCVLVQLTTNKQRPRALHFYMRQGFQATHEGLKYFL